MPKEDQSIPLARLRVVLWRKPEQVERGGGKVKVGYINFLASSQKWQSSIIGIRSWGIPSVNIYSQKGFASVVKYDNIEG